MRVPRRPAPPAAGRPRSVRSRLLLAALLAAAPLAAGTPAAAEVREVSLTQDGPVPAELTLAPGDVVRFVNDDTFVHRVVSEGPGWRFDTRDVLPGGAYSVPTPLSSPGRYAYSGEGLDTFTGSVLVVAAGTTPPAPDASASPSPSPSAPASTAAPGAVASPSPGAGDPGLASRPGSTGLAGPEGARRLGLPAVLALVLAAGVGSLLVRVLLAEAPARRDRPGS